MSVSDLLIKAIKGCVQQFMKVVNNNGKISDNHLYMILLGQTLEKIFNKGLITQQNTLYFIRTVDPYAWMVSIIKAKNDIITFAYKSCVDCVKERRDIYCNIARFRLLVKYCLARKCLHVPVEFLMRTDRSHLFYTTSSIIGDEILSEILLSVLLQMSKIHFSLDLRNSSFLDCSWEIPDLVQLELVPCKNLGLGISFTGDRAVIVNISSNSVAAENGHIKMGDVLDKLNETHITSSSKGHLSAILRSRKTKPISLTIAKAYNCETKEFFPAIKLLLNNLNLDSDVIIKNYGNFEEIVPKKISSGYDITYLGSVDVGKLGSVKQVERAMRSMLVTKFKDNISTENGLVVNMVNRKVTFEIGEIGVKIKDVESNVVVLEHSYMKISSCGNIPIFHRHFGYCASDENCDVATHFDCYVFEAAVADDADTILQSIGQGFRRTHYAV